MATKQLKASVIIGGTISGSFRSAMSSAQSGLKQIGAEIARVEAKQRQMAHAIQTFGRMGKNVDSLRQRYAALTAQAEKLKRAQAGLARVNAAIDRNNARQSELRGRLGGAVAGGIAVGGAVALPVRAAAEFETAMLGVAKQVNGARDAAGNLTPVYYRMGKAIQELGREIPLTNNELAGMVEAAARMGIQGERNLIDFTRTAAIMATAFDAPADELSEKMAKVATLFKIPIPAVGDLADSINWLDDNTVAKGSDIIGFLERTGGVAGAVKVTGKEMAALGSTMLSLGETEETAATATNALFTKLAAAEKGTKKFRRAVAELGLSTKSIQAGMQVDAKGTIMRVLDAVNRLPKENRMGVLADLVGLEHSDTLAKLAGQTEEFRKQLKLANSESAKGSMSKEFQARAATSAAELQKFKNRISEAGVAIGSALLPALNDLMDDLGPIISGFASWATENKGVVKGIVGAAVGLTALRIGMLSARLAAGGLKGTMLELIGLFWRQRTAALAAATASQAATAAGGAAGVAGRGGRIGKAASAIGGFAGKALLVGAVTDVAAGSLGLTGEVADQERDDANWNRANLWEKAQSAVPRAIEHTGRLIGASGIADEAQAKRVKRESEYLDRKERAKNVVGSAAASVPARPKGRTPDSIRAATPAPGVRGARASTPQQGVHVGGNTYNLNVTQLPGESGEAFARRVMDMLKSQEAVSQRGRLSDRAED